MDITKYNRLYFDYYKKLCYHSFLIVHRKEIAEEIVQDVFLKIWQKRETLILSDNIGSYLYRSVLNESLNFLKKQKRNLDIDNEVITTKNFSYNLTLENNHDELRKQIRQAIKKLPYKTRRVFIMNRKLNLSYLEIASRLNISVKGVEYHICNALKLMRSDLNSTLLLFYIFSTMGKIAFNVISIKVSF